MTLYFENLTAWKKAFLLTEKIHILIKEFPKEEQFALTDQMRRSSLSVVSNIAEWSGRGGNAEYAHFLHIAKWSCMELYTQVLLADKFGYIKNVDTKEEVISLCEEVIKILYTLVKSKQ